MSLSGVPIPNYLTLRLDVLSGVLMTLGDEAHQARDGVSVREVRLLLLVRLHPGLSMSRLVELAFMEKTMASKAVTALTQAGLLERRVGEEDARQVSLHLTRKGAGVAERAHRFVQQSTDEMLSVLPEAQRTVFFDTLGLLCGRAFAMYEAGGFDLQGRSVSGKKKAANTGKAGAKTLPISSQAALKRQPARARN